MVALKDMQAQVVFVRHRTYVGLVVFEYKQRVRDLPNTSCGTGALEHSHVYAFFLEMCCGYHARDARTNNGYTLVIHRHIDLLLFRSMPEAKGEYSE